MEITMNEATYKETIRKYGNIKMYKAVKFPAFLPEEVEIYLK